MHGILQFYSLRLRRLRHKAVTPSYICLICQFLCGSNKPECFCCSPWSLSSLGKFESRTTSETFARVIFSCYILEEMSDDRARWTQCFYEARSELIILRGSGAVVFPLFLSKKAKSMHKRTDDGETAVYEPCKKNQVFFIEFGYKLITGWIAE